MRLCIEEEKNGREHTQQLFYDIFHNRLHNIYIDQKSKKGRLQVGQSNVHCMQLGGLMDLMPRDLENMHLECAFQGMSLISAIKLMGESTCLKTLKIVFDRENCSSNNHPAPMILHAFPLGENCFKISLKNARFIGGAMCIRQMQVRDLFLERCFFGYSPQDRKYFINSLNNMPHLESLRLYACQITPSTLEEITTSLTVLSSLTRLGLSNNRFSANNRMNGTRIINGLLDKTVNCKKLILHGLDIYIQRIKIPETLQELDIGNNDWDLNSTHNLLIPTALTKLSIGLPHGLSKQSPLLIKGGGNIEHLDISSYHGSLCSCWLVSPQLEGFSILKSLNLCNVAVYERDIMSLAKAFQTLTLLQNLDISNTSIMNDTIFEGLGYLSNLITLKWKLWSLPSNTMAAGMANLLKTLKSLESLEIPDPIDPFNKNDVELTIGVIKSHCQLRYLDLTNCFRGSISTLIVLDAVRNSTSLVQLRMTHGPYRHRTCKVIVDFLRENLPITRGLRNFRVHFNASSLFYMVQPSDGIEICKNVSDIHAEFPLAFWDFINERFENHKSLAFQIVMGLKSQGSPFYNLDEELVRLILTYIDPPLHVYRPPGNSDDDSDVD